MFDAIITEAIKLFKFILQELQADEHFYNKKSRLTHIKDSVHYPAGANSFARFEKTGVIPHESALRLKKLFPRAAVCLDPEFIDLYDGKTNISSRLLQSKLMIKETGAEEERFNNQNRLCTYVVQMPSNWNMYIVITLHTFKN